jgi:hypothetical protein
MSTLLDQARTRVPRFAEAAVERARLSVVPRPALSGRAARVPFVTLVSLLLIGGVAGLLFFNTSMQQTSFTATALEGKASVLQAQRQSLQMQLDALRDPQRVAARAKRLGMVPPVSPAFVELGSGRVLGDPQPAVADDALRLTPYPTRKPKGLVRTPVKVDAKAIGAAAAAGSTAAGTKNSQHATTGTTGGSER